MVDCLTPQSGHPLSGGICVKKKNGRTKWPAAKSMMIKRKKDILATTKEFGSKVIDLEMPRRKEKQNKVRKEETEITQSNSKHMEIVI